MTGFVKAMRSEEAAFLDTNPLANHVLNVIARRARRTPDPLNGLQIGECFVGHKGLGLSEQQYRTVKKNLQKWGLVEFKKAERVTDRGTVAKLLDSTVYDINEIDPNGKATEDQRKTNGRVTEGQRQTKNVIKKEGGECKNLDNLFEQFWQSGMRKIGKKQSMAAFKTAANKHGDIEQFTSILINDVKQRISVNQFGFDKLHPERYLKNERWTDEVTANERDQQPVKQRALSTVERVAAANGIDLKTLQPIQKGNIEPMDIDGQFIRQQMDFDNGRN